MTHWGDSLSLTLDQLGRAPSLKAAGPVGTPVQLATMSWNQSGALTSLDHQVNVFSSPTWSPLAFDRLDAIDSVGGALVWFWLRQDGATAPPDTLRDSVTYDGWNRVQRWTEWSSAGGGAAVTRDYTFDPTGNLFGGGGLLYDRTTGRLTKEAGGGLLTWDRAGNLTAKLGAGLTYGYDALERLVSVRQGGVLLVRYGYDVAGRRIAKRVYSGATGGTVGYLRMVYAGNQVAFETDSNNTGLATVYTWGPGVDNLVALKVGTTHYTVVTDALGSVRALVRRQDGSWAGRLRYDPYGQLVDSAGPQPVLRYRWTGREWDAETGFYFHRSRYYDPGVGRFVQEDRIGYAGGGNLYAYVNGDVLQARDPDGLTKDATWAYLGWNAMCLGVDICFGDGGEVPLLTGGATYGQRQANALAAWGQVGTRAFDLWSTYYYNYHRLKAAGGDPGSNAFVNAMFYGSDPLSRAQFAQLLGALGNEVRWGASFSGIGPFHETVTTSQVVDGFLQRLAEGRVFLNSEFVELYTAPNSVALTGYSFTILHESRFFGPQADGLRGNYAIHEQLHQMFPPEGTRGEHCVIYRASNKLSTGFRLPQGC